MTAAREQSIRIEVYKGFSCRPRLPAEHAGKGGWGKVRCLLRVGSVDMADSDAQVGDNPSQEAGGSTVQIPASHDVPATGHQAHHRRQSCHATAKSKRTVGPLQDTCCDAGPGHSEIL